MIVDLFTSGLSNSVDQFRVGSGSAYSAENADLSRIVVEGIERYGVPSTRASAHNSDLGLGLFYAEYEGRSEYLAIVRHNGSSTAQLYSVNPSTMAFTAISHNGSDALTVLHESSPHVWRFAQYSAYIYAYHPSGGVWKRRVGGPVGAFPDAGYDPNDAWKRWEPLFERDVSLQSTVSVPPYVGMDWPAGTTIETGPRVTWGNFSGFGAIGTAPTSSGLIRMYAPDPMNVGGWLTVEPWGSVRIELTDPNKIDLSVCDYIYFTVNNVSGDFPHFATNGEVASRDMMRFYISESDVTPTEAQLRSDGIHFSGAMVGTEMRCVVDLSSVPRANRNSVKTIVISFHAAWTNPGEFTISKLRLGGVRLSKLQPDPTEYCYGFYNPSTQALTAVVRSEVPGGSSWGEKLPWLVNEFTDYLGARASLTASPDSGLNTDGYTKIRFYRRAVDSDRDPNDQLTWKYLGEVDNSGSPAWTDTVRWDEAGDLPNAPELSFGGFGASLAPDAMGVWKSHMVVAQGRWLFISYAGEPDRFLPMPSQVGGQVVVDDISAGRTVAFSQGDLAKCRAIVGMEPLFIITDRGIVSMLGEEGATATPPRLHPWSRKPLGVLAATAWADGVAVASSDGIFYSGAMQVISGSEATMYPSSELTAGVRASWRAFAVGDVVLEEHDGELFAFCNSRFMRLKKGIDGLSWCEGTWSPVTMASAVPGLPFRAINGKGGVIRMLSDSSGVAYTTDAGTPATWQVESGEIPVLHGARAIKFYRRFEGDPRVYVKILEHGSTWNDWEEVPFGGQVNSDSQSFPTGVSFKVKATGTIGTDRLIALTAEFDEGVNKRR